MPDSPNSPVKRSVSYIGGEKIFKINPTPKLDTITSQKLQGIPAEVLMEEIRRRLAKYPENRAHAFIALEHPC